MRVIFLGTAHGLPEPNRKFSCIMIEVGENRYFVDMGCNAAEEMATRGVSFDSIKAIFSDDSCAIFSISFFDSPEKASD